MVNPFTQTLAADAAASSTTPIDGWGCKADKPEARLSSPASLNILQYRNQSSSAIAWICVRVCVPHLSSRLGTRGSHELAQANEPSLDGQELLHRGLSYSGFSFWFLSKTNPMKHPQTNDVRMGDKNRSLVLLTSRPGSPSKKGVSRAKTDQNSGPFAP